MIGNDNFGSGNPNADRRGSRGRGKCPVPFCVLFGFNVL